MKEETKLIKKLGQYLLGSKGKTKKKVVIERHEVLLFETNKKQMLGLEYDKVRRFLNILQEFDSFDHPSYRIPRYFIEGDYEFGKCPTCGNLAVIPILPNDFNGTGQGVCVEPPNFHRFTVSRERNGEK